MTAHRLLTASLVGVVVAIAVAGVQAKRAFDVVQAKGVTATIAGVPVHITPPPGGNGKTITLPADAQASLDALPAVALGALVVSAALAFFLTRS